MRKTFGIAIAVILVVAVVAVAGVAYAQTGTPQPQGTQQGYGRGMSAPFGGAARGGGMMGGRQGDASADGLLSAEMHKAVAAGLGLSEADLTARESKGETAWEIAQAKGISTADFQKLMTTARTAAIESLLKQGKITQQQADWFKTRTQNMPAWGMEDADGDGQPDCGMQPGAGQSSGQGGMNAMRGRMGGRFQK